MASNIANSIASKELFKEVLGSDSILDSDADRNFYGKDACKDFSPSATLILLPKNIEELSAIMRICNSNEISVVPSGGRTGYSAGATATNGEIVVSLEKMNKILEVSVENQSITCEAGVTTEKIRQVADAHGLFYGVDFSSKGSSHIGGNIATNAGGIRVIRFGNTRNWVLGLKVVVADGTIMELNGPLVKNQTGYDLRHLFIGSEGTLGIIGEATLRLVSKPPETTLAICGLSSVREVLGVLASLATNGFCVQVLEYFDRPSLEVVVNNTDLTDPFEAPYASYCLVEIEGDSAEEERFNQFLAELFERGKIGDVVVAQGEGQKLALRGLRERISECLGKHAVVHKNDISVPVSKIPDFCDQFKAKFDTDFPDVKTIIFGHVGDGNLHVQIVKSDKMELNEFWDLCKLCDKQVFEIVKALHGSISAEHGVGLLKKQYLHYSRSEKDIVLMKGIKRLFDPKGILNPGKIFDM